MINFKVYSNDLYTCNAYKESSSKDAMSFKAFLAVNLLHKKETSSVTLHNRID